VCANIIPTLAKPAMKWFPLLLSQRWISFRVLFIFNDGFKMGCNFPLISCWPSMRKNWLLVSWACAKLHGYSLAEHAQKLVTCWLSIREIISVQHNILRVPCVLFPLSPVPLSPSPIPCFMSPVLCPLSYVSLICLPSAVPSLTSLFLVCLLCLLFHISVPCLPSSVPCLKWSVPSPILLSPYPPSSVPCLKWSVPSPLLLSPYP